MSRLWWFKNNMSISREEKMMDVIKELAAKFLERESNRTSLITVTNAQLSNDKKKVTIFMTVFPDTNQEKAVIDFANRKKREFYNFIISNSRISHLPSIIFAIDEGEKARQRIDDLSRNL